MSSKARHTGDPKRLAALRVADSLNERFLALARAADNLTRKGMATVTPARLRRRANSRSTDETAPSASNPGLARWARVKLSQLHLRVGQSIDRLDSRQGEPEALRRQLCALLDEVERIEGLLRQVDAAGAEGEPEESAPPIEALFDSGEVV